MRMQRFLASIVAFCAVTGIGQRAWAIQGLVFIPTSGNVGNVHVNSSGTTQFEGDASGGTGSFPDISDWVESGADCAQFSIEPDAPPTVTNIGSPPVTFTVTFTPTSRGPKTCTYTSTDNDGDADGTDTFVATGTGTSPNMSTTAGPLTFSSHVGVNAATQIVTITNTNGPSGNETLDFTAAITTGATDYSVSPTSGTVAAGASANVTITFNPDFRGTRNGVLTVTGDDVSNPSDTVTLNGTGTSPVMTTSPASLTYGATHVGVTAVTQTVTISNANSNPGNESLTWTAVITAGASDFSVTPAGGTLAAGSSTDVTVTFVPFAKGTRPGTLTISGNDTVNGSDAITLSGSGTSPTMVTSWTGSPGALDFGSVAVASGNSTRNVTIQNVATGTGDEDLDFSLAITAGGTDYTRQSPFSGTLAPGASTTVAIVFDPTTSGTRAGTATITGDDTANLSDAAGLTGSGTSKVIALSPAALAFGNVKIPNASTAQAVTITNPGVGQNLSVSRLQITGTGATNFEFTDNGCAGQDCQPGSPYTILPGGVDNEIFNIRCRPSLPSGAYSVTLTVTSTADSGTNTVPLTCTGTAPDINVTGSPVAFGNRVVGTAPTLTFAVGNTSVGVGSETLDYTMAISGAGAAAYSLSPACTSNCTVAANSSQTVTVTFSPTARIAYPATVTITHDDPSVAAQTVTLSGTGIAPVVGGQNPASQALTFPPTDVGATSAPMSLSIQNVGDSVMNVSSVTLVGANPTEFSITTGSVGAHTVAINATDTWQVTCRPTSIVPDPKTATVRIASDALGAATVDFTLSCSPRQAIFGFSPAAGLDFGSVLVGTSSAPLTVTITNNGNRSGTLTNFATGNGAFTFTTTGGPTLAVNGTMSATVTFTPVNGNNINTSLTATTDGSPATLTVPLHGDGRLEGQNVTVTDEADLTVTLGNVRVNTLVTKLVTVTNEGDVPFTLSAPGSDSAICALQPISPASYPTVITGGSSATFNIRTTPIAIGAGQCQVTVQSVTEISNTINTDTIDVSWIGVAPELSVSSSSIAFGNVDVGDGPATRTVDITNTGQFELTVSGCSISGDGEFTLTTPCGAPFQVAVAGSSTITIEFDPDLEALYSGTFHVLTDGFTTPNADIPMTGVGVDQNITLPALSYDFPDTFRNPDPEDTPTVNVVVENPVNATTGEGSPLTVSMAIVDQTNAEVFVVADAGPYTIQPAATGQIPVEFRPTAAPAMFDGVLTITNDTTGEEMAEIQLHGRGVSRNVALSPGEFDLQTTGVGVPVRLSELTADGLIVTNMDPSELFVIRELGFVDADGTPIESEAFELLGDGEPQDLAPMTAANFDLEFAPLVADDYEVLLAVYLDNDPMPQTQVRLTGRAVDVELHGGGGCQAGGGGGGWGALALGAASVLGLRRRRRVAAGAVLAVGLLLLAVPAHADRTRNIDITTFAPAPSTEVDGFQIESPVIGVNGAWALDLTFSHATNVLTATSPTEEGMTDRPVSARTGAQLAFAYAFLDQFEAGVRVPFFQSSGEMPQFSGLQPADGSALGDVAAHVKARLFASGALAAAASLDVTVPTATADQYAGVDGPTAQVRGLAGWRGRRAGVSVNLGFVARSTGDLADIKQGNALTFGGGGSFRTLEKLWVIAEMFGSSGMGSPNGPGIKQLEAMLGVRYQLGRSIGVSVGGGRGILTGIGAPDIRGFAMIDVAPRARPDKPLVIRKPPPPRDTGDEDEDGIVNADDTCRSEAEDVDQYKDDDGCPEVDNDEDGLLDGADTCPNEAEDSDGFLDEDGCIDPDNDADKILDVDDRCPMEPEDLDGHMDNDGCDEPDNDADGIPDVIDQCALEPETINGTGDDDGCPDAGDSAVMVMPDRIEIFEAVQFDGQTAKISKKSASVLGQVAATLRANREFTRIRVTVHVHPRADSDQSLSDKRAKAVRDWLIKWGIEPERVEAKGMGSARPLVQKSKKGAAALNDRVEFIILEKENP